MIENIIRTARIFVVDDEPANLKQLRTDPLRQSAVGSRQSVVMKSSATALPCRDGKRASGEKR